MEILNDLTKCNFYYYILGSNKAYLIFNYLQYARQRPTGQPEEVALDNNNICIGDAMIRRQKIVVDDKIVRYLNKDLKQQYNNINDLKLDQNVNLKQNLIEYSNLGYLLVVQYLVSKGANIHIDGDEPLSLAATNGHLAIIKYLVSIGAYIRVYDDRALFRAVKYGHLKVIQYFLNPPVKYFYDRKYYGSDIHAIDDLPLRWAAEKDHLTIVQYLVSKGANIHADNDTSLRLAAQNGHLQVVQYLLSVGANIHADNDGRALRWAVANGNVQMIQNLTFIGINNT